MCPENTAAKKTAIITRVHIVRVIKVCFFFSYSDTGGGSCIGGINEMISFGLYCIQVCWGGGTSAREVYLLFAYFSLPIHPISRRTARLWGSLTYFRYTRSPALRRVTTPMIELDVSSHHNLKRKAALCQKLRMVNEPWGFGDSIYWLYAEWDP